MRKKTLNLKLLLLSSLTLMSLNSYGSVSNSGHLKYLEYQSKLKEELLKKDQEIKLLKKEVELNKLKAELKKIKNNGEKKVNKRHVGQSNFKKTEGENKKEPVSKEKIAEMIMKIKMEKMEKEKREQELKRVNKYSVLAKKIKILSIFGKQNNKRELTALISIGQSEKEVKKGDKVFNDFIVENITEDGIELKDISFYTDDGSNVVKISMY